jgi:D-arginine dehydrogenase
MSAAEILVVGGGIAGVSIAAELALEHSVLLLEQEQDLGRHATGRSAATFVETLGGRVIRALTRASRPFLDAPPEGFGPSPLSPMSLLYVSRDGDLQDLFDEVRPEVPDVELLDGAQTDAACGYLRPGLAVSGLFEPRAMEVDVAGLHQGYVRALRSRGGEVLRGRGLAEAAYDEGRWVVTDTAGEQHRPRVVVNAAGAWCDEVARHCAVEPIGIQPMRRTVFTVPAGAFEPRSWPMLVDGGETFYAKPETGQFLCSPMDETPEPPGDPRPEELDIARTMEALAEVTTLAPRRVLTSWAGLRSFAPDRLPVVGPAPDHPGFFWFAGQGGVGVQTSPALARAGAAVLAGRDLPADLLAAGLSVAALSAGRPALLGAGGPSGRSSGTDPAHTDFHRPERGRH